MWMFVIFASVLILMLLGVSTAVTMGFASITTFLLAGGDISRLFLVPQRMFAQVSGITLMSIPFFLLMGNLMTVGGVSKSLFGFGRVCLGHRWGGLSNAAIVACVVMAAMSGSAAACAAGIGMIAIAEMTKSGYERPFSCATIAAGGALGPIIPVCGGCCSRVVTWDRFHGMVELYFCQKKICEVRTCSNEGTLDGF